MGLIFYLSSLSTLPSAQLVLSDFIFKKAAHMFVYAVLWLLVLTAAKVRWRFSPKLLVSVYVFCILYAISDEFHQSLTPGRHPSVLDVGFDTLGMYLMHLRVTRLI